MNDQQAAEYMAGIESEIQAARWALPVDFARDAYAERFAVDGEPHADLEISGDHRPRIGRRRLGLAARMDATGVSDRVAQQPAEPTPVRCDYCGDLLPAVKDRAHIPTTPDLQRLGFSADNAVCPECVTKQRSSDPGPFTTECVWCHAPIRHRVDTSVTPPYEWWEAHADYTTRATCQAIGEPDHLVKGGHQSVKDEWWLEDQESEGRES